jgi:hypothetical protein
MKKKQGNEKSGGLRISPTSAGLSEEGLWL